MTAAVATSAASAMATVTMTRITVKAGSVDERAGMGPVKLKLWLSPAGRGQAQRGQGRDLTPESVDVLAVPGHRPLEPLIQGDL